MTPQNILPATLKVLIHVKYYDNSSERKIIVTNYSANLNTAFIKLHNTDK